MPKIALIALLLGGALSCAQAQSNLAQYVINTIGGTYAIGDDGPAGRGGPAIEGPEVDAVAQLLAEEAQPGEAGVGGFRHRPGHVEVEDRLSAARA